MTILKRNTALTTLMLLGLSACGGGGGGSAIGDGDVPLASKSDVIRELGVLDSSTDFIAQANPPPAAADPAPPGLIAQVLGLLGLGGGSDMPDPETAQASETTTTNCDGGGTVTSEKGNVTRSFVYFDSAATSVNFERATASACTQSGDTSSTTTTKSDGVVEDGHSLAGADGPAYTYAVAGVGSTPFTLTAPTSSAGAVGTRTVLGLEEARQSGTTKDSAQQFAITYDNTAADGQKSQGSFQFGQGSTPFRTQQDTASGALQLTGAYAYTSLKCSGGNAYVSTSTPITGSHDDTGYYPTAGAIKIATASSSATVTFFPDGSATYTLANGQSGQITRAELSQVTATHPCD